MESRSKYLIKNVGILTISNFASKILVFLLVPLYTSILSTNDVGLYDLIVSTVSVLVPLLTLNIVDAVMRFLMDENKSKEEIAVIGIRYVLFSSTAAALLVIVLSRFKFFSSINGFEIPIILYFVSYVFNNFMIQFTKGLEKIGDMGIAGVLGTVTTIVANILLLIIFKFGLLGFFAATIFGQAVPAIYLFIRIKLWDYIKTIDVNRSLHREMIIYCAPLITTTVGWWVNNASDKYIVSIICGVGANGILAVSYKIPQIINTLHGIFTQAWQISAIKEYEKEDSAQFYGKSFILLNVLLAGTCSVLIILSKPLAYVLYQNDFYIAWQYVPFLLISCAVNSASGFYGSILSAKKDSKSMAMSAVYGAAANIIMNILLVLLIGIQGAAIATAISSLIIYYFRKRAVKNDIVVEKYIIVPITWGLLCAQSLIEIYTSLWWIEIIIIIVMAAINRNNIMKLISFIASLIKRKGKKV